jgi:hypothetical protein
VPNEPRHLLAFACGLDGLTQYEGNLAAHRLLDFQGVKLDLL